MDPTFAPESRSLGDLPDLNSWEEAQVQWLRPAVNIFFISMVFFLMYAYSIHLINLICLYCIVQEILKAQGIAGEPVFCTNGASRFDFSQGAVGK